MPGRIRGRRGYIVVRAKPWLGRQLDERGVLVFWHDGPDGRRVGLACAVETCRNPDCNCRDAILHGIVVDDLLVQIEVPTGKGPMRTVYIPSPAATKRGKVIEVLAKLDLDGGEVRPGRDGQDEALLGWLRDEANGELLDLLQRRWVTGKDEDPDRMNLDLHAGDADPRGMLSYNVAYPGARPDVYVLGDRRFRADELYDTDPGRRAGEAEIVFQELRPGEPKPPPRRVGSIRARIRDGRATAAAPDAPAEGVLIDRLWATYCRRHDVVLRLAERQHRMWEIGAFVLARPRLWAAAPPG